MSDNATTVVDPDDLSAVDDWFELYNPSAVPADLAGYHLTDKLSNPTQFTIPGGVQVPARGSLRVWADNNDKTNGPGRELHVNFALSRNGEAIGLFAPDGSPVDTLTFTAQAQDRSDGRWPDGDPEFYRMSPSTPGGTNQVLRVRDLTGTAPDAPVTAGRSPPCPAPSTASTPSTTCAAVTGLPLGVVTALGLHSSFADTNAPPAPLRFYRVSEQP